jgi:hypothetical protein
MNKADWSTWQGIDTPKSPLKSPSSGVTLWNPELVLADRKQRIPPPRRLVMPGEPVLRPEAVRAQVDAAKTLLRSFTQAHEMLGAEISRAEARGTDGMSERERVSATIETYRLKAEMDDVLKGTMRKMMALMEGRSVR